MKRVRQVIRERCQECGKDWSPSDIAEDGLCRWCNIKAFLARYEKLRARITSQ